MAANPDRPPITPETKVGELLEHYPELEDVLIELSPSYKALRNPVLRRTVARVATLRQVAKVGDVALGTLIGRLRTAVGQAGGDEAGEASEAAGPRPDWAHPDAVTHTYDARETLEAGGRPMERVMADLARLQPGEVYEVITPFAPAPLVEMAEGRGFNAYSAWEGPELVRTYFRRPKTTDHRPQTGDPGRR